MGLIAHSPKFSSIGYTIGARAFELLLVLGEDRNPRCKKHPLIGSWIGDEIAIIGDQGKKADSYSTYLDITANMIEMLYRVDGSENLLKAARSDKSFFTALGYLIFTNQLSEMATDFEREFGVDWSCEYKKNLRQYAPYNLQLISYSH